MTWDKPFFTIFEYFNGANATFEDGSMGCVKDKRSITLPTFHLHKDVLMLKD